MLGEKIDKRRIELDMSKSELADKSGLTRQYVGMLINNQRGARIGAKAVNGLATALGVKPDFFLPRMSTKVDNTSRKVV